MKNASKVIIVPGYGMAVAQAQHALREMADTLKEGVEVKYAIHPVAGRMPGHMNVLLAEATCPTTRCSNSRRSTTSSPPPMSPTYRRQRRDQSGGEDRSSLGDLRHADPGRGEGAHRAVREPVDGFRHAGVDNELFFRPNTTTLFGDAKKMTEEIVQALGH